MHSFIHSFVLHINNALRTKRAIKAAHKLLCIRMRIHSKCSMRTNERTSLAKPFLSPKPVCGGELAKQGPAGILATFCMAPFHNRHSRPLKLLRSIHADRANAVSKSIDAQYNLQHRMFSGARCVRRLILLDQRRGGQKLFGKRKRAEGRKERGSIEVVDSATDDYYRPIHTHMYIYVR